MDLKKEKMGSDCRGSKTGRHDRAHAEGFSEVWGQWNSSVEMTLELILKLARWSLERKHL
jgi:hypothetical protein